MNISASEGIKKIENNFASNEMLSLWEVLWYSDVRWCQWFGKDKRN